MQRLDTHPSPRKQRSYYRETIDSIVPLARRHPWFREWYDAWQEKYRQLGTGDGGK